MVLMVKCAIAIEIDDTKAFVAGFGVAAPPTAANGPIADVANAVIFDPIQVVMVAAEAEFDVGVLGE